MLSKEYKISGMFITIFVMAATFIVFFIMRIFQ